jgi:hypothetical protein
MRILLRIAAISAIAAAASLLVASSSTAAPRFASLSAASPASVEEPLTIDALPCNHRSNKVCLEVVPFAVRARLDSNPCLYDFHFHFWGPNNFDLNTPHGGPYCPTTWTQWYDVTFHGRGTYCVEGWWRDPLGVWHSIGLPCATI